MLAGSSTAAATLSTDTSSVQSPPAARPPRRRGLSYLRSYTFGLDSSQSNTNTELETRARNRRSRTTTDLPSNSNGQSLLGRLQDFDLYPIHDTNTRRAADTESNMSRNRVSSMGLDGAGVSTTNEYTSRVGRIPVAASRDASGAHQALLSRVDGLNSMPAPSIQFLPATDTQRSQRPSLDFKRITRVLPNANAVIKVGRYSERDSSHESAPSEPSDAPIGFKSKVVSRKHCEFSFQNGQWYIKDVKSSSGTFLNHIRLSQPGLESKPFPVNDGDIVQLGIDFKGGEEMIFRCVKIRVETNRGWQRGLNKFNKSTHKRLQELAKGRKDADNDAASKHSSECTICLNSIAPCQALFVAPCSHTWHYKCIRTILESNKYPSFLCPNCRAQADLDADVDEGDLEDFDEFDEADFDEPSRAFLETIGGQVNGRGDHDMGEPTNGGSAPDGILDDPGTSRIEPPYTDSPPESPSFLTTDDIAWTLNSMNLRQNGAHLASLDDTISGFPSSSSRPITNGSSGARAGATETPTNNGSSLNPSASAFVPSPTSSEPVPVPSPRTNGIDGGFGDLSNSRTPHTRTSTLSGADMLNLADANSDDMRVTSPDTIHREGPMTPRNAAGPFVFDGAGRTGSSARPSVEGQHPSRTRDSTMVGTDPER